MPKFRVPHTLVLLFGMVCIAFALTFILPKGEYKRTTNEAGRELVVAGSYQQLDQAENLPPLYFLTAVPKGLGAAKDIIFFVFIVGGTLAVLRETGAIDAALGTLLRRFKDRPLWLIASGVLAFAVGSSTIGMAEEYLPFIPILMVFCLALGFDSIVAVGVVCLGYAVGYGVAMANPFQVVIAWDLAGLDAYSGNGYRLVLTLIFAVVAIHHLWRYASMVKRDPSKSLVADVEMEDIALPDESSAKLSVKQIIAICGTVAAIVVTVIGIKSWHWYLEEMMALFLGLTVFLAVVGRIHPDKAASRFCHGAAELTSTALLIGVARAIQVVLDDGKVVDTIIHAIAQPLQSMGGYVASVGMLVFQSLCNLFIPSGSGQAYVTMPVMAPLADLVDIPLQVAVLAFQFGDGFTNILVPTNAVLVGMLAMARIPYERWVRFVFPFMIKIWILCSLALMVAVAIKL